MDQTNSKIKTTLFILTFPMYLISGVPVYGQTNVSEALAYVDVYVNMRFAALPKYYMHTTAFQDPTLELIAMEAASEVIGKDQIINKLRRNFKEIRNPRYKIVDAFTVGRHTIINGIFEYDQNGGAFGGPDITLHFSLKTPPLSLKRMVRYRST